MQANIAIIIIGFNRPRSLDRLLSSISTAEYNEFTNISLIISIDYSGDESCRQLAEKFEWIYGEKKVIVYEENLGLKKHVLCCGEYSQMFEGIIVLEDDLIVSPQFYDYAQQAYHFYQGEPSVAGIALYHNTFNEVAHCPFEPINDGFDNYFMQVPCSWGQLWTKEQWAQFSNYCLIDQTRSQNLLPKNVQAWSDDSSWKKLCYYFLMDTGRYFVYPRVGLSTNFGEAGHHLSRQQTVFQTSLLLSQKKFSFQSLQNSVCVYDGYYELKENILNEFWHFGQSVTFDLNGTKPLDLIKTDFLISSKRCTRPLKRFSVACYPYENNILLNVIEETQTENFFSLAERKYFSEEKQIDRLILDLKRVFSNENFVFHEAILRLRKSVEFRIGHAILRPFRRLARLLSNNI